MRKNHGLEQFMQEAVRFVKTLAPLPSRATVVGLYGDLGAGKTTFIQAAAKALGVSETVNSPTFLIMKSYLLPSTLYRLLIHVDAYRLKNSDELRKLRFDELLVDPGNLILVEWAERVAGILPKDHLKLNFEFIDEGTRRITL